MAVNYEIKSQLAKLLATEDLVVENRHVETAQFNVETRVLTLPMWKRASETVYDLLVGHEVGHALFTPDDWSWEDRIPQQFVNVTEDARIEKLMKRRYPGLSKSFYQGYKEMSDNDFFEVDGKDLSKMNLADRINLQFKIGNFIDVPFSEKEMEFVEMVGDSETFGDAVLVAELIYKYCKDQIENQEKLTPAPTPNGEKGDSIQGPKQSQPKSEQQDSDEDSEESEEDGQEEQQNESADSTESQADPLEVQTDDRFNEGAKDLVGNTENATEMGYFEMPEFDVNKYIISNERVHQELDAQWEKELTPLVDAYGETHVGDFGWADDQYKKFKKNAQREVNFLVKEFECKKSADAYARAATSRTGVLDCTKLHTYKFNEDLFKKVTTLPDGKNHGLIFLLDWSGSMAECILDTLKQVFNLVWFCNKANIPFELYAFTNSYLDEHRSCHNIDWKENTFWISNDFSLLNLLSSTCKAKDFEKQMLNVWRSVFGIRNFVNYHIHPSYNLSGTPLNEAIVCLHKIIPAFKKNNGLQKVQCLVLTDGEANSMPVAKKYYNSFREQWEVGTGHVYAEKSFLRNRKTGMTYKFSYEYYQFTEVLLTDLRATFPDTNLIGIRIAGHRDIYTFARRYNFVSDKMIKEIKKEKFVSIDNSGYTKYFGLISQNLSNDVEFDVEEGASKTKIKSAFAKNLKAKSLNKKVLSQFMDLVC